MEENDEKTDYIFKFILIGESGVGKTNLVSQFEHRTFSEDYKATIGVDFSTKIINVKDLKIKITCWDTAGQERYRSVVSTYYKGADGVLLLYDITNQQSFHFLPKWVHEMKENSDFDPIVMLVGNKSDLENSRSVSIKDGKKFAKKEQFLFIEASAKEGTNVSKCFDLLALEILGKHHIVQTPPAFPDLIPNGQSVSDSEDPVEQKKSCC